MGQYNIPKLARNKYNFVKGADGNNYVTQSQISGRGGGGLNSNSLQSNVQLQSAIQSYMESAYVVTSYDLKTINGYSLIGSGDIEVTGSGTIDMSSYVTKDELNQAGYITNIDMSSYATKTYVADYVSYYSPVVDLTGYVTKDELDAAGYTTVVQTTYDNYKNMSYAEKTNGYLYIVSDYEDTAYYITDEDLAYASYVSHVELNSASYATTAYVESVKTSCYNYTDSKMSYSDVVSLINNMIDAMKQNGDLVDAAYVMSKVNGG